MKVAAQGKIKVHGLKNKSFARLWSGFTLIELLVVIAIIGIMSSLLLANYMGVRARARDAKRKSDMSTIRQAMELYRADNGHYPNFINGATTSYGYASANYLNFKNPDGTNPYLTTIPHDPLLFSGGCASTAKPDYYVVVPTGGVSYTIFTKLENTNDPDATSTKPTPTSMGGGTVSGNEYISPASWGCPAGVHFNYWINNP